MRRPQNPRQCTERSNALNKRDHSLHTNVLAQYNLCSNSLPGSVRLPILEDETRLALRKVQQHLGKVAVCPREPRPSVRPVVDVDRLVDEAQACSILRRIGFSLDIASETPRLLTLAIVFK